MSNHDELFKVYNKNKNQPAMRKFTILALIAIFSLTFAYGQRRAIPNPDVFTSELMDKCDFVKLPGLDETYVKGELAKLPKEGQLWEIARAIPANLSMESSGSWFDMPNGDKVWMLRVKTPNALATTVDITDLFIPVGAMLYITDPKGRTRYGAYTNADNGEAFASDFIAGDEVVFEYVQPKNVSGTPRMTVKDIYHLYRGIQFNEIKSQYGNWLGSESCEINIVCTPEGTNWVDEARGVCVIYVVVGVSAGWCTGSLINNTAQNCTPYLLSAYHCYAGASTANLNNSWRFLFKYQSSTCTTQATEPVYTMMTGCTLKAQGNISGGSDFILLQLNSAIGSTINAYMNGWNKGTTASSSGVSIHHPAGDIKKISTYTTTLTPATPNIGGSTMGTNAAWRVVWAATTNGHGVTEGGSSGSPLFDANGFIIGTLSGGGSYCSAPTQADYYGRFSYHWNSTLNGTTSAYRLQEWLDPGSTGVTTFTGMNCPGTATLTANFTGSPTTVTIGQPVTFTNASSGSPTTYSWNFGTGASPQTATTVGPHTVTYSTVGLKTVTLTVGDGTNTDVETKNNYINVTDVPTGCDTAHYPLAGTPTIYGSSNGGYVSGNNGYGDKAKADYFSGFTSGWTISEAFIYFGAATGSSSQVPIKIWNDNGTGGAPGTTALGTVNVPISTIITDVTAQQVTYVTFTSPVAIDGSFFVGVVLPTVAGDSVAIVTNTDGDTSPGTAWEQWSDNVWYAYSDGSSWGMNVQHAIWPLICDPTNVSTSAANNHVSMFPNPAYDMLNLYFGNYQGDIDIVISDILGKEVMRYSGQVNNTSAIKIDISDLRSGIYMINCVYDNNSFTDKLQILK